MTERVPMPLVNEPMTGVERPFAGRMSSLWFGSARHISLTGPAFSGSTCGFCHPFIQRLHKLQSIVR